MMQNIKKLVSGVGGIAMVMMLVLSVMSAPVSAGTSSSVTYTLEDEDGNAIEGLDVTLTETGMMVDVDSGTTDANGQVTFTGMDSATSYEISVDSYQTDGDGYMYDGRAAFAVSYDGSVFVDSTETVGEALKVNQTVYVSDSDTKEPVPNATVEAGHPETENYSISGTTDANGKVILSVYDLRGTTLSATADGYSTDSTSVDALGMSSVSLFVEESLDNSFTFGGGSSSGTSSMALLGGGLLVFVGLAGIGIVSMRD